MSEEVEDGQDLAITTQTVQIVTGQQEGHPGLLMARFTTANEDFGSIGLKLTGGMYIEVEDHLVPSADPILIPIFLYSILSNPAVLRFVRTPAFEEYEFLPDWWMATVAFFLALSAYNASNCRLVRG